MISPRQRFTRLVPTLAALLVLAPPTLAAPDPPPAATITGESGGDGDSFGWGVSSGDVNGDGVPDLFIGAPTNDAVAGFAGRAYLFNGPVLGDLAATAADARITAQTVGDNLGVSVSIAGDVNDDGFDDLLTGARGHDTPGIQSGRAYLFLGPRSGSLLPTQAEATFTGLEFEELGWSVHSGGDLNDDGFADVVLGAPQFGDTNNFSLGRAYVFSGPVTGIHASTSADAIITGEFVNDTLGSSVAIVRDVNGDGIDDVVAGAPHGPIVFVDPGRAYVFFGPVTGSVSAANADVILTGETDNDLFGTSVASAGDVNNDGVGDLLIGAEQTFNSGPGKAYLFLGPIVPPATSSTTPTATFIGEVAQDAFGHSVASAGDVNGDGFDDVLIGAYNNGAGGGSAGRAYVFFGPLQGTINAADADLVLTGGTSGDSFGRGVACVGDQDGDLRDDILVGATQTSDGDPGLAHVFLGGALATSAPIVASSGGVWLGPAFPNPARGLVTFSARLAREGWARLRVVDVSGRRVRTQTSHTLGAGAHHLVWDGRDESGRRVGSGVYFVQLYAGGSSSTRAVTIIR
jgi:hypothetical protein